MSDEAIVKALCTSAVSHLIGKVMECENISMPEAMKLVYSSKLYQQINDYETGLYREGPVYLYGLFNAERGRE